MEKRKELAPTYEPKEFEGRIGEAWEKAKCFQAKSKPAEGQKNFCIVVPPPNVTGVLHMGHALTFTVEDILVRWRRMEGDNALFLPGTDHAGIATQAQVERAIKPVTRQQMGREKFLERTWKWKEDHHGVIVSQLKRMGASLDWSRERFTMDDGFSRAVREVFVRLYEDNLIYRGERIINWCVRCQTALSDLEVIPKDKKGHMWHIRYPVVSGGGSESGESLVVATTRPETMLADTAVAVHPEDDRYKHLHGKSVKLPLVNRVIPIVVDEYVDREFGTGVVKITPAHDFNDFDVGQRHKLPILSAMGKDGKITAEGGVYAGLGFQEARVKVVEDLTTGGFLEKTEDHLHKVGHCQRCDSVAEPLVSNQWFVKIKPLADPAIKAVEEGRIQFTPKSWEKTYFEWMYNIRDWCISRQLWWGHQIPAWHCGKCAKILVAREAPKKCESCGAGAGELKQDEDVLDTWFSSGLWPFGTLGWPEKTDDLQTFYPTSILETGFDIIFFWVARMIMMGIHFMGDVPFSKVYLHAMVRDEKGEKMSKSKGNVIDPLVIMDQHGADPLRFTFAIMAGQGRDIKLSVDRVAGYRAFCNKLWNATKFFHFYHSGSEGAGAGGGAGAGRVSIEGPSEGVEEYLKKNYSKLTKTNQWILSELQNLIPKVRGGLENFELNVASQSLYDFTWHEFCDWFVELSKYDLKSNPSGKLPTLITLHYVLDQILKLLHPFIPYVTEELWQSLPWRSGGAFIATEKFPQFVKEFSDASAVRDVGRMKAIVEGVRNFRGESNISPKTEFDLLFHTADVEIEQFLSRHRDQILSLARLKDLRKEPMKEDKRAVIPLLGMDLVLMIPLEGLVNVAEELARLGREIDKARADIEHVQKKLSNKSFVDRAPGALVQEMKDREGELQEKLKSLEKTQNKLKSL